MKAIMFTIFLSIFSLVAFHGADAKAAGPFETKDEFRTTIIGGAKSSVPELAAQLDKLNASGMVALNGASGNCEVTTSGIKLR